MEAGWEDAGEDVLARFKAAVDRQQAAARTHPILKAGTGYYNFVGWPPDLKEEAPALLVQLLVVPAQKTKEGAYIEAVTPFWIEYAKEMARDPEAMFRLNARQLEEFIAGAYSKAGFDEVILTPRSADAGRDVIAIKKGVGMVRVIDQVKAYSKGHLVTADDVRALYGVVEADRASKGFLTTTSDFAPRLREDILLKPLMPDRIELINGTQLHTRLRELVGTN